MPSKPIDQKWRLERNTEPNGAGCWVWQLGKDRVGYGRIRVSEGSRDKFRTVSAHRYAWELWNGPIPDGMNVLHRCDNRACCNPGHLFLGTHSDNMRDMHAKGRGPRGYSRDPEACRANAQKPRPRRAIDTAIAKDSLIPPSPQEK